MDRSGCGRVQLRIIAALKPGYACFKSHPESFVFRGSIRSADGGDNIGTALLLELPDRAVGDKFWNEKPFAKNFGYARDSRKLSGAFWGGEESANGHNN
jgi:hypothetical protein